MPERFPHVSDDIAFELLILHAVADRGRPLKGARAAAMRKSPLWETSRPMRRPSVAQRGLLRFASALVIASTLGLTPATSLPAWAQRQDVRLTVVDLETGKPLSDVVLRDSQGNALGRTRADGKMAFRLPAGEERFALERSGYQSVSLTRSQLGGSNLVSMRRAGASAAPSAPPAVTPAPVPTAPPPATPQPPAEVKVTPKPTAKPAKPPTARPEKRPQAAPMPQAPTTAGDRYVVRRGDTLWDIAEARLGNPLLWTSLYEANRATIQRPNLIHPGQTLVIPAAQATPRYRGTRTVRKGDTLWDIAEAVYGNPLRWKAIYEANRQIIAQPNLIYPGQTLVLPR